MPNYRVTIFGKTYEAMADLVRQYRIDIFGPTARQLDEGGYRVDAYVEEGQISALEAKGYKIERHENTDQLDKERWGKAIATRSTIMDETRLLLGIACIIGAIVGGGLRAAGIEVPIINSLPRQIILALAGSILIAYSQKFPPFELPPTPTPSPSSLVIYADADKSWPVDNEVRLVICNPLEGRPCPTSTPVNENAEQKVLDLSSCPGSAIAQGCINGLVAIRFNLASIPAGAKINKAILNLYAHGRENFQIYVQRATSPWKENQLARPECDTNKNEKVTVESVRRDWNHWDVTAIVRNQFTNSSVNYGFCINIGGSWEEGGQITFAGRYGDSITMPYLEIEYQL
jgi:hypothetical protein